METQLRHPDCAMPDHVGGLAAIRVTVLPTAGRPIPGVIERCDSCAAIGRDWSDDEARAATAALEPGS